MDSPNGEKRIEEAFKRAQNRQLAALMPYFTLGYPDYASSLDIIAAISPYSDLLELGVPFSDPIADGPTIQMSSQKALEQGITPGKCIEAVYHLRQRKIETPILLMSYTNPIIAYGEERLVADCAESGVDGLIVPDLPLEEAASLRELTRAHGMALVYFVAPTSDPGRIGRICEAANGFIYLVSVTGVTGARGRFAHTLADVAQMIRQKSRVPLAIGFGVSTPEQAADMAKIADGVIVGSALISAVSEATDKVRAAVEFVDSLRRSLVSVSDM